MFARAPVCWKLDEQYYAGLSMKPCLFELNPKFVWIKSQVFPSQSEELQTRNSKENADKFIFIKPLPNKHLFLHVCSTSLLKTLGKREIACQEQSLLFPHCFLPIWRSFCHFLQILHMLSTNSFSLKKSTFSCLEMNQTVIRIKSNPLYFTNLTNFLL